MDRIGSLFYGYVDDIGSLQGWFRDFNFQATNEKNSID